MKQEIIKSVRGLQNRHYVVWSLRSITSAPSSVAPIRDDFIKFMVLIEKVRPKLFIPSKYPGEKHYYDAFESKKIGMDRTECLINTHCLLE